MNIELKELNNDNWLETANLSVSEKEKEIFPIPNVYWIGVSRYEEHTTLYAIMLGETVIGLLGLGYDEDGVSGFINPIMIDEKYQGNHYAENAMTIAIDILKMRRVQRKHQQPLNSSKLCFVHLTNSQQMNQNHILI